jgi:nucleoside-diphosphate kinase
VERTLVICKPDAVERGLIGEIINRLERKGLRIVAAELRTINDDTASRHYAEHVGKPFYPDLVNFIGRGPAMVMVVAGPAGTWKVVRTLMGPTNPAEAPPGTIRGDLAIETTARSRPPGRSRSSSRGSPEAWIALRFGSSLTATE